MTKSPTVPFACFFAGSLLTWSVMRPFRRGWKTPTSGYSAGISALILPRSPARWPSANRPTKWRTRFAMFSSEPASQYWSTRK